MYGVWNCSGCFIEGIRHESEEIPGEITRSYGYREIERLRVGQTDKDYRTCRERRLKDEQTEKKT